MELHNDLYREIAEQAPDGVIVASVEGKILFWNDRAAVIFGYSGHEVVGQSSRLLFRSSCVTLTGQGLIVRFLRDARELLARQ
jgi:PAS domain-containing protein